MILKKVYAVLLLISAMSTVQAVPAKKILTKVGNTLKNTKNTAAYYKDRIVMQDKSKAVDAHVERIKKSNLSDQSRADKKVQKFLSKANKESVRSVPEGPLTIGGKNSVDDIKKLMNSEKPPKDSELILANSQSEESLRTLKKEFPVYCSPSALTETCQNLLRSGDEAKLRMVKNAFDVDDFFTQNLKAKNKDNEKALQSINKIFLGDKSEIFASDVSRAKTPKELKKIVTELEKQPNNAQVIEASLYGSLGDRNKFFLQTDAFKPICKNNPDIIKNLFTTVVKDTSDTASNQKSSRIRNLTIGFKDVIQKDAGLQQTIRDLFAHNPADLKKFNSLIKSA